MSKLLVFFMGMIFFACSPINAKEVEKKKELKFGLLPYISSIRLIKTFLPLKQYLEKSTSYAVTFLTAPTFEKFVERTQEQRYDIVFTAPHFALLAEERAGYERLARFSRELTACVFVRKDSKVKSLADLKGSAISTPDSLAIVSVLGEVMFKNAGLVSAEDVKFVRTPSHNNAIISVASKSSEAGIVASTVYEQFVSKGFNKNKFKLLNCSEAVPTAMFLVKGSVSEEDKDMLMKVLLTFSQSRDGKVFFKKTPFKGMRPVADHDMKVLEKYMAELKARL